MMHSDRKSGVNKSRSLLFAVLCMGLMLLLSACGDQSSSSSSVEAQATATPEAIGLDVYQSETSGLSNLLLNVMRPFQSILSKVASSNCNSIDYCIPGQILNDAGQDAKTVSASVVNNRWSYTVDKGGNFSWTLWGQDVISDLESSASTADEENASEDHMEFLSGDTERQGGGVYAYRYVYDLAADGTSGAVEIYSTLNGYTIGHERFDYRISENVLYFTDAALDAFSMSDGDYPYIIVCGVITADELYTVDFTVHSKAVTVPDDYPAVSALTKDQLFRFPSIQSSLSASNGKLVELYNGKSYSYTLN